MKTIPLVQFIRPHGREHDTGLKVSDRAAEKWESEIASLGLRLTAEIIPGGGDIEDQICVCIENPEWGDYRLSMCPSIPGGPVAREVERLIMEFDKLEYHDWLQELTEDK